MSSAAHDLQAAIVAALKGDASLVALLGDAGQIRDHVPPGRTFPMVVIGRFTGVDWSTDTGPGMEQMATIRCWSRETGRAQVLAIGEAVAGALDGITGVQGGTRIVHLHFVSSDCRYEPADLAWRATLRLRALTEPAN
jgi:Protein of unknown function (DUF3168)